MKRITVLVLLMASFLPGCPGAMAVSPQREAYILAGEHGWIELTFVDDQIPGFPPDPEKEDQTPVSPQVCSVEVVVNNEPYLREYLYVMGDNPPFLVDTGFRFAVPAGKIDLDLEYRECRPGEEENEKSATITLRLAMDVKLDSINQLVYRNGELTNQGAYEEPTVTLQDIDARLRAIEEKLQTGR